MQHVRVLIILTEFVLSLSSLLQFMQHYYDGESKSKGKIHLTALIEVTVSSFTYHFST